MTVVAADRRGELPPLADVDRFDADGYLVLPGLFAPEVARLRSEFDAMAEHDELLVVHCERSYDASATGCEAVPRLLRWEPAGDGEPLAWLRDDLRISSTVAALLGPASVYRFSHANLFNCDVRWHDDAIFTGSGRHLLVFLYLQPLDAGSGALRVVPGSHRPGPFAAEVRRRLAPDESRAADVPGRVLAVEPGDVVVLDFATLHASFGGGVGRRSISLAFGPPVEPGVDLRSQLRPARPEERATTLGR
jgi:hypothetical protein